MIEKPRRTNKALIGEVERRMRAEGIDCVEAIGCQFGIDPLL